MPFRDNIESLGDFTSLEDDLSFLEVGDFNRVSEAELLFIGQALKERNLLNNRLVPSVFSSFELLEYASIECRLHHEKSVFLCQTPN